MLSVPSSFDKGNMVKDGKPTVSVIIPSYNAGPLLRDAIESVMKQTYGDCEIIVIDDGSTDETPSLIHSYGTRIRSYRQANRGASAARNLGIAKARGKYIAFLDSDDVWLPTKLAEQVPLLDADPSLGLVYSDWTVISGRVVVAHSFLKGKPAESGYAFEAIVRCGFILTSGVVVRKTFLDLVGGFDESLVIAQDYDLWLRLCYRWKIALVNKPLFIKRNRHAGLSADLEGTAVERVALFEKALSMYPDLSARHRRLMRQQLMQNYWDIGYNNFARGTFGAARRHFLRSLKAEWTSGKSLVYLFASCLPVALVRVVRKAKRTVKGSQPSLATLYGEENAQDGIESLSQLLGTMQSHGETDVSPETHSLDAPDRQEQRQS